MKSGLQEKKKLKAEGTKAENVKEVVRGKHKVLPCYDKGNCHGLNLMKEF